MASLKDVAKEAGVSISTVSRVLNDAQNVNLETRLRVQNAIKKLKYQPSRVARRLRVNKGQSNLIGLLIPDIRNPFYVEVIRGVEEAATQKGYAFIMSNFSQNVEKEKLYLDIMLSESVDGLIVAPAHENDRIIINLIESGLPVVCIDRMLPRAKVDAVVVNNREGSKEAIEYLISMGHRRIALLSGPLQIPTYKERLKGYQEALVENGITIDDELIKIGDSTHKSGCDFTKELLAMGNPPTAIFAGNNLITLGALEVLHLNKVKIPENMSIIGFDDVYWAISLNPPLTAVSQPGFEIGRRAADLLLNRILEPNRPHARVILDTQLMIRQSCAPIGQN